MQPMTCPHSTHACAHPLFWRRYICICRLVHSMYSIIYTPPYPTPTPKTSWGIYSTSPVGEWTINAATCGSWLHALQSLICGSCNCLLVCCMCTPKHSKIQLLQWCRTHLDQLKQKHASLVCMAPPCCSNAITWSHVEFNCYIIDYSELLVTSNTFKGSWFQNFQYTIYQYRLLH